MIVIDDASKKIESNSLFEIKEDTAKDATVAAAAQKIIDRIDKEYGAVFAKSEVELNGAKAPNGNRDSETNNGDLITDAMLWKVLQNKEGLTVECRPCGRHHQRRRYPCGHQGRRCDQEGHQ